MKDLTFADIKFNSGKILHNIRRKLPKHPFERHTFSTRWMSWGKSVGTKLRICRLFIGVSQERKESKVKHHQRNY